MLDELNLELTERTVASHAEDTHVRRCFVRLQAESVHRRYVDEDAVTQRLPRFDGELALES